MKIGIITFHRAKNYGAVLQTYALQHYIESVGGNVEVVDYLSPLYEHYKLKKSKNFSKSTLLSISDYYKKKSYKRFDSFVANYLHLSPKHVNNEGIRSFLDEGYYSDLITGSDQVWNPDLVNNDAGYLLDIPSKEIRLHSYAASIGLEGLGEKNAAYYKACITRYTNISVREGSAKRILRELGINSVEIVSDPTLLLSSYEWANIENKISVPEKYVLVFAFGYSNIEILKCAKEYATLIGAKVCLISNDVFPMQQVVKLCGLGPAEWLYAIHNAECVFTNSYHGLLFSIVFRRNFWVDDPKDGTNSRIIEILRLMRLEHRTITNFAPEAINYDEHFSELNKLITRSKDYISCIINGRVYTIQNYGEYIEKTDTPCRHVPLSPYCTGCSACMDICPINAIKMLPNAKDQLYPVVNEDRCISCSKCTQVCPIGIDHPLSEDYQQKYFALKNKNSDEVKKTSSGGVFILLAREILRSSGIVYGVVYSGTDVKYGRASMEEELWTISGTKYVESDKGKIFASVRQDLESGKTVFFTGTPCTVFGLKRAVKDIKAGKLITMDIICHGVPSPTVYKDYLKYLEGKYHSKVLKVNFRAKEYDEKQKLYKHIQRIRVDFENGKTYFGPNGNDPYYKLFWSNCILRECCYSCQYANLNRVGDITIGDFWGKKTDNGFFSEGTESSVIINTEEGEKLFESIRKEAFILEVSQNEIMQRNLQMPTPRGAKERVFWFDYMTRSFKYVLFRYADSTGIIKLISKIVKK